MSSPIESTPADPSSGYTPLPSVHPSSSKKEDMTLSRYLIMQYFKSPTPSPSHSLTENSISLEPCNQEKNLEQTGLELMQLEEATKFVQESLAKSENIETVSAIIETWMVDYIVKGGQFYLSMPASLEKLHLISPTSLTQLEPVLGWIRAVSDVLENGAMVTGVFFREKILKAMEKTIAQLQAQSDSFDEDQMERFQQLSKLVNFERQALTSRVKEQSARAVRNYLSILSFGFSWVTNSPLISAIAAGVDSLYIGIGTVLAGISLYRAQKGLNTLHRWTKGFIGRSVAFFVNPEKPGDRERLDNLKEKRNTQRDNQIKKLEADPAKMVQIKEKVYKIKVSVLKDALNKLDFQTIQPDDISALLQKKLGGFASLEIDIQIQESFPNKQKIEKHLEEYVKLWVETQEPKFLISTYVDYQAVLDTSLKNSLVNMIKVKHQEAVNFLAVKRNFAGISFSLSSVLFGVGFSLLIIGLASNPVGASALLMFLIIATVVTVEKLGLTGAGYYYAYREQPRLTSTILKGAYLKLFAYYVNQKIFTLVESIETHLLHARQNRREQLAASFNGLPVDPLIDESYQRIELRSKYWKNKAEALEKEMEEASWKDFAEKADLRVASEPNSFDTLDALAEALSDSDLTLLSKKTIEFLEKYIGVNISTLQDELDKNPEAIKKVLKKFFNTSAGGILQSILLKT